MERFDELNRAYRWGFGYNALAGGLGALTGINYGDLAYMYRTPWTGDLASDYTVRLSFNDLMRSYQLKQINFRFNINTHRLVVLGRTPLNDVYVQVYAKIPYEEAYDDPWVRKYIIAKVKRHVGRSLGLFTANIVGGTTINASLYTSEADKDIEECQTYFSKINSPDWFIISH